MTLKEIYADKKSLLDSIYVNAWQELRADIENDEDYTLADDEIDELIGDLMLSSVLGEIARFDEVSKLLEKDRNEKELEELTK